MKWRLAHDPSVPIRGNHANKKSPKRGNALPASQTLGRKLFSA